MECDPVILSPKASSDPWTVACTCGHSEITWSLIEANAKRIRHKRMAYDPFYGL